jgi:hypothetical protein
VAERLVDPLLAQAHEHAQRVVLEREQRAEIAALRLPVRELELLSDGVELGGLYRLADSLRKQAIPGITGITGLDRTDDAAPDDDGADGPGPDGAGPQAGRRGAAGHDQDTPDPDVPAGEEA